MAELGLGLQGLEKVEPSVQGQSPKPQFLLYPVLMALSVLVVIALGAFVTSRANANQLNWHPIVNGAFHRLVATGVGVLGVWLAFWLAETREAPVLGWAALACFLVNGCLGWLGGSVVVLHATLAPVVFGSFVSILVVTSAGWKQAPELVAPQPAFLRRLVFAAPVLLVLQTLLGATYRHKLTSVLPHIGFAMIVTVVTLAGSVLIVQHYPKHRALRPAAIWMMLALGTQVALGFATLTMQVLERGSSFALALVISSAVHVVVGSITMAASFVLALQVQRHVRPSLGLTAEKPAEVPLMAQKDH